MVVWDPWNSSVSVSSFDLGLQQMAALPSAKTSLQSIPRFILRTHQHDGGFPYSLPHSWDISGPWDYFPWNTILFKTYFPWFMNYPHYIVSPFQTITRELTTFSSWSGRYPQSRAAERQGFSSCLCQICIRDWVGRCSSQLSESRSFSDISDSNLSSPIYIANFMNLYWLYWGWLFIVACWSYHIDHRSMNPFDSKLAEDWAWWPSNSWSVDWSHCLFGSKILRGGNSWGLPTSTWSGCRTLVEPWTCLAGWASRKTSLGCWPCYGWGWWQRARPEAPFTQMCRRRCKIRRSWELMLDDSG